MGVRFKAVAGQIDRAAGIAVRLTSSDSYYVARANALEGNVRFYRVVKGRREELQGANIKVTSNEWHTLALTAEGERFTVSFDGKALFTANDKTISDVGKIALWTKADSVTRFDRIEVNVLACAHAGTSNEYECGAIFHVCTHNSPWPHRHPMAG